MAQQVPDDDGSTATAVAPPGLKVLVVEDEALIALELECLLDDLGHVTVGVAGNATEAIAMGRSTAPDVALVDIHLVDGPTGIDVARALSADRRTTVVFMTANAKRIPSPSRHAKVWVCPEARDGSRVSGRFVCVLENHTYARLVVKR